jgi:3-hydroxybutyryl-CoA dehydratase
MTYPVRETLTVGESASLSLTVTDDMVTRFAELTQDSNPVHLNDDYAAKTRFGKRIAHGVLAMGLISAVLGTKLPGPGAIYLNQQVDFLAPVYIGDQITAEVTVGRWREDKKIATLNLRVFNQDEVDVVKGTAVLLYEPVI